MYMVCQKRHNDYIGGGTMYLFVKYNDQLIDDLGEKESIIYELGDTDV